MAQVEEPPQTGAVVVRAIDSDDQPLTDACFALNLDDALTARACDGDDGANDGETTLSGMTAGTYALVEDVAPTGYETAKPRSLRVRDGKTTSVKVKHHAIPDDPAESTGSESDQQASQSLTSALPAANGPGTSVVLVAGGILLIVAIGAGLFGIRRSRSVRTQD